MKKIWFSLILALLAAARPAAEEDLVFTTNPPGAGVFLEGRKLGNTPLSLDKETTDIPYFSQPGRAFQFILYKEFFEGEIFSLTYERGKKEQVKLNLHLLTRLPLYDGQFQAGYRLDFYELLMKSSPAELKLLRNEIYAKHGKPIDIEGANPFALKPWYKINPYYSDEFLDGTDHANLALIDSFESRSSQDFNEQKEILATGRFSNSAYDYQLHFISEDTVEADLASLQTSGEYEWKVFDGSVYIWNEEAEKLLQVFLLYDTGDAMFDANGPGEITHVEEISLNAWDAAPDGTDFLPHTPATDS